MSETKGINILRQIVISYNLSEGIKHCVGAIGQWLENEKDKSNTGIQQLDRS